MVLQIQFNMKDKTRHYLAIPVLFYIIWEHIYVFYYTNIQESPLEMRPLHAIKTGIADQF